ncbi:MAG: trypsin-like peptidase domain-containing protein [Pirellulaceae bacterium]|nr:trypsin-like peptidase domain-containing protein [Pirellulaceae bacterium]
MRRKNIVIALVPLSLIAAVLIQSAVSNPRTSTSEVRAVDHAESMSTAFRNAADAVLPTVVKIKSVATSQNVVRRGSGRPDRIPEGFRGFEDFFGPEGFSNPEQFERAPRRQGTGSGIVIQESGLVLTNNHVVEGADVVTVELPDGREYTAENIRTDPQTDLAILRIKGAGKLKAAKLGNSDRTRIGDWVLAVGNPFELEASVSAGIISAKGRSLGSAQRASFLQTDAAINPGNSGGPLVNLRGEVVGINTAIASSSGGYQGIGFAIPINLAKWVAKQLVSSGTVSRAWLGVSISPVTQESAETLNIDPRTPGVVVQQVGEDTPAERAGVRPGDVITHFGDKSVAGPAELQRAVERAPLGTSETLRVLRRGKRVNLKVEAEALPDQIASTGRQDRSPQEDNIVEDASLGIRVSDVTADLANKMKLNTEDGVVVVDVASGSVAAESGVARGMLILEIDGAEVDSSRQFQESVGKGDLDKGITLTVKVPGVGTRFLILKNR